VAIASAGIYALIGDYLQLLETFITHFEGEDLFFHRVYINLSVLYRVNGEFDASIKVSLKEKETLEPKKGDYPTWYSTVMFNIAVSKDYQGDYSGAEKYYLEGANFLEQVDREGSGEREEIERELIFIYSQLGILQLQTEKNDLQKAEEYFRKGLAISDGSGWEDPLALASLKEGLALALIDKGEYQLALENLNEARQYLIDDLQMDRNSLPVGVLDLSIAQAYAGNKDFSRARSYVSWSIETLKRHLREDNLLFCRAYNISAIVDMQEALDRLDQTGESDVDTFLKAEEAMAKAIRIMIDHRGPEHEDLGLMYSNYGLMLKFAGDADKGYEQQKKAISIFGKAPRENGLIANIFFRTIMFFEEKILPAESEKILLSCLKALPEVRENELDAAFFNYMLGYFRHKNGESRKGIDAAITALNGIRKFYGKDPRKPENDSPLEVICIQEIAAIHADLGEHHRAIQWQEEAVQLCEEHMDPSEEELAEPYALLARIHLSAARGGGNKKSYADALEYKTMANTLSPKAVQSIKELEDTGELYLIAARDKDVVQKRLMIIPAGELSRFEADFRSQTLEELNNYGYVLPARKEEIDNLSSLQTFAQKYGGLNDHRFADQL
jgi:tetratricopeptide (TPR) repeat protein